MLPAIRNLRHFFVDPIDSKNLNARREKDTVSSVEQQLGPKGSKKIPPWAYVGAGCGLSLVVGLFILAVVVFFGYRVVSDIGRGLTDPAVREERVKEFLGAEKLPDGYYPAVSLSIPMLLDLAVLADTASGPSGGIEKVQERAFVYLRVTDFGEHRRELLEFLEGRNEEFQLLEESRVKVQRHEFMSRGRFEVRGAEVVFASYRAEIEMDRKRKSGIASIFTVNCPAGGRLPIGIWFGPDPWAARDIAEMEIRGTPADEEALRAFLGHFSLCDLP